MSAPEPPIFLDLEASGITGGGYPIEVGRARARLDAAGTVELEW
ncbi:hypothetical protein [Roseomonas acroporae]|nr:hypothetical protein [Roseomonas acroporae]